MSKFSIKGCTAREVLEIVMESHERDLHALNFVEKLWSVNGNRLRFNCKCRSFAVFTDEAIRQDFGYSLDTLYERLGKMGYVR